MKPLHILCLSVLFMLTIFTLIAENENPDVEDCSRMLAKAPRIHVATMSVGDWYQQATYPSYPNKEAYCEKHGYAFHAYTESLDTSRPIPWSKVLIILEIFDKYPDCKWVFWTDADSLIMNSDVRLEDHIDQTYDMIAATDSGHLNSGQMLIRNCKWSKDFLSRIYAKEEFINNGWWEQSAMMDEFENNHRDRKHCKLLKQRSMNSTSFEQCQGENAYWHEGDFIIHFAGARGDFLVYLMRKYADISK